MKPFLSAILFVLLFSQCRKDNEVTECEIITPGSYFPAYPGSWWKYTINNSVSITYKISNNYQYFGYDRSSCYPIFDNIGRHISGNSILQSAYFGKGGSGPVLSKIYSEQLNVIYPCVTSFSTFKYDDLLGGGYDATPYRRVTLVKDTTISTNNVLYFNVLLVKEYNIYDSTHFYYDYFSKDIGLVKRDSIHISDTTNLMEILSLQDYFIHN